MACRDCEYFTSEGENRKGYCSYYKAYYYPNETCKYEKRSHGGCFMTTACCEHKGLPDDCYELTKMRYLRDRYLKKTRFGKALVDLYYAHAPGIVENVKASSDKDELLDTIYLKIKDIVSLIDEEKYDEATSKYVSLMIWCELIS